MGNTWEASGVFASGTANGSRASRKWSSFHTVIATALTLLLLFKLWPAPANPPRPIPSKGSTTNSRLAIGEFKESLRKCRTITARIGPPLGFSSRSQSDRWDGPDNAPPVRIRNATVWTGRKDGHEILREVDLVLSKGLITDIVETKGVRSATHHDENVIDAQGRWVTPGIIDIHVHMGVDPLPSLPSVMDHNTRQTPLAPFLRSLDGLNQHDLSFKRTAAGGVTSSLALPGSAGNIGGQAFPIKLRSPKDNHPSQRIIDAPESLVLPGSSDESDDAPVAAAYESWLQATGTARGDGSSSFRHMKMACGENARRFYGITRMDEAWGFRQIFERARSLKQKQDQFCDRATEFMSPKGDVTATRHIKNAPRDASDRIFPDDLELEALVAVLRGQVKVNTHCYTGTDFESFVRHTNEFKFPVAAFHHAHEAYMVPELIKGVYGPTPAVAIFSTNGNYKMEAYFGSPHAGAILKAHNITPLYKSDHPVTDSRRVLSQAAQGHAFGLDTISAMQSVTTAGAKALGLEHRIGYVDEGHDADVVIWNSHPLRLGATPLQVFIDGQPQLGSDATIPEPELPSATRRAADDDEQDDVPRGALAGPPLPGDFAAEIKRVQKDTNEIMQFEKLPFRYPSRTVREVAFHNVSKVFRKDGKRKAGMEALYLGSKAGGANTAPLTTTVLLRDGVLHICSDGDVCANATPDEEIDLQGGALLPGISSFGSNLGLTDIVAEQAASDGAVLDPFAEKGFVATNYRSLQDWPVARAVDGLQWGGNDLLRTYAHGVIASIVAPQGAGFLRGVSTQFTTGGAIESRLNDDAIRHEEVAMHVALTHYSGPPSISEQIALLRRLLEVGERGGSDGGPWARVAHGQLPLVVEAARASHIASIINLKHRFKQLKLVLAGAAEASLMGLPDQLAEHDISVLLSPLTWEKQWDGRRALAGPPLTNATTLSTLVSSGVKVGFRIEEGWQAANLLTDVTWAAKETNGLLDEADVVGLLCNSLDEIFNLDQGWRDGRKHHDDYVAYQRDPFEWGSKIVAIGTSNSVRLFDN